MSVTTDSTARGATAAAAGDAVVEVRGLTRVFNGRRVLDGVDLTIGRGEIVALIGRSGSGKSTLLRILAGLDGGATGEVVVPKRVSVAFQDARLLLWKRVRDNVALGLRGERHLAIAEAALSEVGLSSHLDAWPLTLSGGEAQRVALARALVREPELADRVVLLADGRIAHEERVSLPRPREREHRDQVERRISLLSELGVNEKGAVL
jgi:sulfonate transport system ATP-binding protein